ncbi:hypothetical protein SF123566_2098 [Shigella flexneri 1235-66]|nr:hypothetical protein SF123566_2098 [Shigella flexneri 1235-66]
MFLFLPYVKWSCLNEELSQPKNIVYLSISMVVKQIAYSSNKQLFS